MSVLNEQIRKARERARGIDLAGLVVHWDRNAGFEKCVEVDNPF